MNIRVVGTSVPSLRGHAMRSLIRGTVAPETKCPPVVQPNRVASAVRSATDQPPSAAIDVAASVGEPGCSTTSNSRPPAGLASVCWTTRLRRSTSNCASVTGEFCAAVVLTGSVWSGIQPTLAACCSSQSAAALLTRQRPSTRRILSSAVNASKMASKWARVVGNVNDPVVSSRWVSDAAVNNAAIGDSPPGSVAFSASWVSVGSSGNRALMRWTT